MKRNNFGPDYRPIVGVTLAPYGISRRFEVSRHDGPITDTPHIEAGDVDLSHTFGYGPMDDETRELYQNIRALNLGISSVSIAKHLLAISGPKRKRQEHYVSGWPVDLELEIVDCLKKHMGWEGEPLLVHRQETEEEYWVKMRNREAMAKSGQNFELGEWPFDF